MRRMNRDSEPSECVKAPLSRKPNGATVEHAAPQSCKFRVKKTPNHRSRPLRQGSPSSGTANLSLTRLAIDGIESPY